MLHDVILPRQQHLSVVRPVLDSPVHGVFCGNFQCTTLRMNARMARVQGGRRDAVTGAPEMRKLVSLLVLASAVDQNSTTDANATIVDEQVLVTDVHPLLFPSCGRRKRRHSEWDGPGVDMGHVLWQGMHLGCPAQDPMRPCSA